MKRINSATHPACGGTGRTMTHMLGTKKETKAKDAQSVQGVSSAGMIRGFF